LSYVRRTILFASGAACFAIAGCGERADAPPSDSPPPAAEAPDLAPLITAERGGIIPEGIEFDPGSGRILAGSLSEGTVFHLHADGRLTPAVQDPDLVSSVGIEVDAARNRLFVANSDSRAFDGSSRGQAKLGVYELRSGSRLAMVDLAAALPGGPGDGSFFANDVAVAPDGTAYVTETFQNVVYRVGPSYEASVFYRFPPTEGLALNGIVHHPSGYLLVAGGSVLYKVPVGDPGAVTEVVLPEPIEGQDGVVWMADGRLAIVSNSQNRVVALASSDEWATASLAGVAPFTEQGTTAAVAGDDVYVVHPHFADPDPPTVERVSLR